MLPQLAMDSEVIHVESRLPNVGFRALIKFSKWD
jgi:hypothetical protein